MTAGRVKGFWRQPGKTGRKSENMRASLFATFLAFAALTASASSLTTYVGLEDTPIGGDRDYQDLTAIITGATLHQTGGVFTTLTAPIVNDTGNVFWDHVSSDGLNDNIGNVWLAEYPGTEYLATPSGGIVSNVYFTGGSTVTITGGQSADHNTLGICYVANCAGTTQWITGSSLTFTATGAFELVGKNGLGSEWYSDPTLSQSSSFAFAQGTETPEPDALWLGAGGLALMLCARSRKNFR